MVNGGNFVGYIMVSAASIHDRFISLPFGLQGGARMRCKPWHVFCIMDCFYRNPLQACAPCNARTSPIDIRRTSEIPRELAFVLAEPEFYVNFKLGSFAWTRAFTYRDSDGELVTAHIPSVAADALTRVIESQKWAVNPPAFQYLMAEILRTPHDRRLIQTLLLMAGIEPNPGPDYDELRLEEKRANAEKKRLRTQEVVIPCDLRPETVVHSEHVELIPKSYLVLAEKLGIKKEVAIANYTPIGRQANEQELLAHVAKSNGVTVPPVPEVDSVDDEEPTTPSRDYQYTYSMYYDYVPVVKNHQVVSESVRPPLPPVFRKSVIYWCFAALILIIGLRLSFPPAYYQSREFVTITRNYTLIEPIGGVSGLACQLWYNAWGFMEYKRVPEWIRWTPFFEEDPLPFTRGLPWLANKVLNTVGVFLPYSSPVWFNWSPDSSVIGFKYCLTNVTYEFEHGLYENVNRTVKWRLILAVCADIAVPALVLYPLWYVISTTSFFYRRAILLRSDGSYLPGTRVFQDRHRDPDDDETYEVEITAKSYPVMIFLGRAMRRPDWLPSIPNLPTMRTVVSDELLASMLASINRVTVRDEKLFEAACEQSLRGLRAHVAQAHLREFENLTGDAVTFCLQINRCMWYRNQGNWIPAVPTCGQD